MARQRDYAAEYARRIAGHRQAAEKAAKPFSMAAARGHSGKGKPASSPPPSPARTPIGPMKQKLLSTITRSDLPHVPPPLRHGKSRQKPLSELSPAYRKRLERQGIKEGESRQKARGHRPGESRRRKEAEQQSTLTGALTRGQKSALRAFFNREIAGRRQDWDEDETAEEWDRFLAANTRIGWSTAKLHMTRQRELAAGYRRADNQHRRLGYRQADLEYWADADGWDDWTWYWYH